MTGFPHGGNILTSPCSWQMALTAMSYSEETDLILEKNNEKMRNQLTFYSQLRHDCSEGTAKPMLTSVYHWQILNGMQQIFCIMLSWTSGPSKSRRWTNLFYRICNTWPVNYTILKMSFIPSFLSQFSGGNIKLILFQCICPMFIILDRNNLILNSWFLVIDCKV